MDFNANIILLHILITYSLQGQWESSEIINLIGKLLENNAKYTTESFTILF